MLIQRRVLADDIFAQRVNLLARLADLVVEGLLLTALLLELDKLILLIKSRLDATLLHHVCDHIFSLVSGDTKELANLIETNVHVDT